MTDLAESYRDSEALRIALQSRQDSQKSSVERNRLGQYATPTDLASDILRYAKKEMGATEIRFLDPAIGTGSFFSALLREFDSDQIDAATGFEVDPHYGAPARHLWRDSKLRLELEDFTALSPSGQYNLLICNPPYVRHHHITAATKKRLQAASVSACGISLSGLAGLYCHFMCLSHPWMATSGLAAWLIPSEFMDVNYGKGLKDYLLRKVTLTHIHRFDPGDVQFADALVSSAVVWFRKSDPPPDHSVRFSYGGSLSNPRLSAMIPATALESERKWTRFPRAPERKSHHGPLLSHFFDVRRGLATGANDFFIMPRDKALAAGIPQEFLRPILPSPRHLAQDIIETDPDGWPVLDSPLGLIDCALPAEAVKRDYPEFWTYLEQGIPEVAERYLPSRRDPWYSQEKRKPPLFLSSYMGRSAAGRESPFRFILNLSNAVATNSYLLLYPKTALASALDRSPDLIRAVWELLNNLPTDALTSEGRVYGGGLHKLEPKELGNVNAESLASLVRDGGFNSEQLALLP